MFVHPRCPCSQASINELARLAARCRDRMDLTVLFIEPANRPPDWCQSALVSNATSIPGLNVIFDRDGQLAAKFGAVTSGYCWSTMPAKSWSSAAELPRDAVTKAIVPAQSSSFQLPVDRQATNRASAPRLDVLCPLNHPVQSIVRPPTNENATIKCDTQRCSLRPVMLSTHGPGGFFNSNTKAVLPNRQAVCWTTDIRVSGRNLCRRLDFAYTWAGWSDNCIRTSGTPVFWVCSL